MKFGVSEHSVRGVDRVDVRAQGREALRGARPNGFRVFQRDRELLFGHRVLRFH